jgi:hypothetical protein
VEREVRVKVLTVLVLAAAILLVPSAADAQCAMCRQALNSPEGAQLISGLRNGILVLLAAPFTLFGTVAYLAIRSHKRRTSSNQ